MVAEWVKACIKLAGVCYISNQVVKMESSIMRRTVPWGVIYIALPKPMRAGKMYQESLKLVTTIVVSNMQLSKYVLETREHCVRDKNKSKRTKSTHFKRSPP